MEKNSQNTALLVMDMQPAILRNLADTSTLVKNVMKAIDHARIMKIPVIYVIVGFRAGAPEISMNNKGFSAGGKERWSSANIEDWMKIHPDLMPLSDDVVVIKRRVSAFTGSDLEVVLRAFGIQRIVLSGVSTSGVVLSTVREAADKDFRITVLTDCCADADPEVHCVLTSKVFTPQADTFTTDEWIVNL